MAVVGEEYCKKVGGVRLEWDLGCGLDCAKDAMSTCARLWLRSGGRSLVDNLPIRSRTKRARLLQAKTPLGNQFIDLQSSSIFPENSDAITLILIPQDLTLKITTPEIFVAALNPTANGTTTTCSLALSCQITLTSFGSQLSGYTYPIHGSILPWTRRSSPRVTRRSPHAVRPQLSVSELVRFGLN